MASREEIEGFLGLSKVDIEMRSQELIRKIPTIPGTSYLEEMLKRFQVQPWPLVTYLAHHNPNLLEDCLQRYVNYDGWARYETIKEGLREYYVLCHVAYILHKKISDEERTVDSPVNNFLESRKI